MQTRHLRIQLGSVVVMLKNKLNLLFYVEIYWIQPHSLFLWADSLWHADVNKIEKKD